jgi:hypothetical protein
MPAGMKQSRMRQPLRRATVLERRRGKHSRYRRRYFQWRRTNRNHLCQIPALNGRIGDAQWIFPYSRSSGSATRRRAAISGSSAPLPPGAVEMASEVAETGPAITPIRAVRGHSNGYDAPDAPATAATFRQSSSGALNGPALRSCQDSVSGKSRHQQPVVPWRSAYRRRCCESSRHGGSNGAGTAKRIAVTLPPNLVL